MRETRLLTTPLSLDDVRALSIGDMVYLRGEIIMMKSLGYARALDLASKGETMPVDFYGAAIYHAFVAMKKNGVYKTHYIGPTLSYRTDNLASQMIRQLGVRAFIGKMGASMSEKTLKAMQECGCVHLAQIGGVTVYNTSQLQGPVNVFWADLVEEKCLVYRAHKMGPLVVSMDSKGGDFFKQIDKEKNLAVEQILADAKNHYLRGN